MTPSGSRRSRNEVSHGLYVSGSGTLVRAMIADQLVDELHLFVYPVTRGAGPRLFDEGLAPTTWSRASADLYDNGVTYLKLTPALRVVPTPPLPIGGSLT